MSKLVVIGIAGAGGVGAVGIGGYALFGNGFGGSSSDNPTQPSKSTQNDSPQTTDQISVSGAPTNGTTVVNTASTPVNTHLGEITRTTFSHSSTAGSSTYDEKKETVDGIKTVTGWPCFKEAFADNFSLEANNLTSETIDFNSIDFGTPEENKKSGCLWLQTKKVEFGDNSNKKYTGALSWGWAFKGADKGLVVFGSAKADKTGKLSAEGVMYLLKKDNENWTVEKKQKSEEKTISTSTSSSGDCGETWKKLPAGNYNKLSGGADNCYWSWLEESELTGKIVNDSNATGGIATTDLHLYSWTYDNSNDSDPNQVYECFQDPHLDWLDHPFPNTSTALKSKVDSWKGSW